MKKKILALVLCLVLCLPFVLTSCFGGNADFNEVISSFQKEYQPSFDTYTSESFEGDVVEKSGKFFLTKETSTETLFGDIYYDSSYSYGEVGTKYTYKYRVYNALTASVLYSATVTYCDYDGWSSYGSDGYTSNITGVSIAEFGEDLFILKETYDSYYGDTSYTYAVYDYTGYCHLSSSKTALDYAILDNLDKEAVIFDETLYLFNTQTNSLESVKTLKENSVKYFVRDLYQAGDKYVLLSEEDVYVFDSQFKQLYGTNFEKFSESKFNSEYDVFVLNNGDILVQFQNELGSYEELYDTKYDYIIEGSCYTLETYLYTVNNGAYEEIDCSYIIDDVIAKDDFVEYGFIGLPANAENIASVFVIEDEGIVYYDNNEIANASISNEGKIELISIKDLGDNAVALNEKRYMVQGEYFTRIYNENNDVIGELGNVEAYNKNFIVTDEAIYDMNLNSVVTLDEDTEYYSATNDSIIYKEISGSSTSYYIAKCDDYGYTSTNHLVTNSSSDYYSYYTTASITVKDDYFYIVETEYGYSSVRTNKSITFYETNGDEITSFDLPIDSGDYSIYSSTFDDCVVFAIKSTSRNYFVTLKTATTTTNN